MESAEFTWQRRVADLGNGLMKPKVWRSQDQRHTLVDPMIRRLESITFRATDKKNMEKPHEEGFERSMSATVFYSTSKNGTSENTFPPHYDPTKTRWYYNHLQG